MSQRPPATTGARPTALVADRLGVPAVTYFVMSAATPLTVVAGVVTTGYATTGLIGIPVAFAVVAVVLAVFSVGYVAMAQHVPNAGAFYAYISQGLGRAPGVAAAWIAVVAYNALQIGLYGAVGAASVPLLQDWTGHTFPWWVIALAAWLLVALLGLAQVDVNGKILAVLLVSEVAVIVVYSLTELAHPADGTVTFDTLAPSNLVGSGSGALLAIAVLGYVGFESGVVFTEESKNAGRTVRAATYLSLGLITVLYTLASWAMSVATGPKDIVAASRTQSTELIFGLARQHLGSAVATLGHTLFVTSVLAAMISFHQTTGRYMFALGRERVLPAALGRTSPRTGAPMVASMTQSTLGLAVIVTYAFGGWDPVVKLFFWGGTSGGLGILVLVVTTSVAVIAYFARHPHQETTWQSLTAPLLASLALAVILYLVVANFATLLGVSGSSPLRWGVPGAYLALAVCGVAWALAPRGVAEKGAGR